MKNIVASTLLAITLIASPIAFAGGWTIADVTDYKKIIKYDGSKVAELVYSGGWQVFCLKGRKRGDSSYKFDTLRIAMQFTTSECKKY